MKTKHIGLIGIVLAVAAIILIIFFSGTSCHPLASVQLLVVLSVPLVGIIVVFVIFLRMSAKQKTFEMKRK
jgi:hypothetical protein